MENHARMLAEVNLLDDTPVGQIVGCESRYVDVIAKAITGAGFSCVPPHDVVRSRRPTEWVEFPVRTCEYKRLLRTMKICLQPFGLTVAEEIAMQGAKPE